MFFGSASNKWRVFARKTSFDPFTFDYELSVSCIGLRWCIRTNIKLSARYLGLPMQGQSPAGCKCLHFNWTSIFMRRGWASFWLTNGTIKHIPSRSIVMQTYLTPKITNNEKEALIDCLDAAHALFSLPEEEKLKQKWGRVLIADGINRIKTTLSKTSKQKRFCLVNNAQPIVRKTTYGHLHWSAGISKAWNS